MAGGSHDAGMVSKGGTTPNSLTVPVGPLRRWMQIIGVFYLAQFLMMAVVRAPIRTFGPPGTLAQADDGDALAKFVVDTWTIFGLEVLAVGVVLLAATRRADFARGAIYTVLAIEVSRGIVADLVMIARGTHAVGYLIWIAIHSTVIATGVLAMRASTRRSDMHANTVAPAHA
jgi:hypothetical protein